ncbi:hypothetical protein C3L33_01170, partial [Rhododendron williamsianum]
MLSCSFLVTIMGLVTPWSLTLALVDVYSVFFKRPSRQPGVMSVIVVGDWVCAAFHLLGSYLFKLEFSKMKIILLQSSSHNIDVQIKQVLSFLSLAAACSTASVTNVLINSTTFCRSRMCSRYQLSAAMTFLSWFLSLASSLFNLWLLPSL